MAAMLTYHAEVIPFEECDEHGVYLMDPHPRFESKVCVYDAKNMLFIGIMGNNLLACEAHINLGGNARPVMFLKKFYPEDDIEIYTTINDHLERPIQSATKIFNWDLFAFLEEYEEAYDRGAFDVED